MTPVDDIGIPIHIGDKMIDRYGHKQTVDEVGESGRWYVRDAMGILISRCGGVHVLDQNGETPGVVAQA